MLRKLMNRATDCCQCQYGNYIMQHLLERGPQAEKEMLLDILKKNFVKLSMNKFARQNIQCYFKLIHLKQCN